MTKKNCELSAEAWREKAYALRYCFFAAVITALIVHFAAYSERLTIPDGVHIYFYNYGDTLFNLTLGRWMQFLFGKLTHNYVLPALISFCNIALFSTTVSLIAAILRVRDKKCLVLIGALSAAYPAMVGTLTIYYFAPYAFMAFCLSVCAVAAVTLTDGRWRCVLLGAVFLALSCAFYQAYIGASATLSLTVIMFMLLRSETEPKDVLKKAAKLLVMGIGGAVLYLVATKLVCHFSGYALVPNSGFDSMGQIPLAELPGRIAAAYKEVVLFFFGDGYYLNHHWFRVPFYIILFLGGLICFAYAARKQETAQCPWRWACLIACLTVLPMAIDIDGIFTNLGIRPRMAMPFLLPAIMACAAVDKAVLPEKDAGDKDAGKKKKISPLQCARGIAFFAAAILVWTNAVYCNTSYALMQMNYNRTYATALRIVNRVEQTEGYMPHMKMMFIGTANGEGESYARLWSDAYAAINGTYSDEGQICATVGGMQWAWRCFFESNLGITYTQISIEECNAILATEEYRNMPIFPADGCMKVINGVMVVKLTTMYV